MLSIQTLIAAAALSLAIGFTGGFYTKGKFVKAGEVSEMAKDQIETGSNILEAVSKNAAIDTQVTAQDKSIDAITAAISVRNNKYLTVPESINGTRPSLTNGRIRVQFNQPTAAGESATKVVCSNVRDVLDVGTVRLLNAANTGAALDAAAIIDGKESTASAVPQ